jgi:CBS domain-containing protein
MTRKIEKIGAKSTIQDAARAMSMRKIGSIFIEDGEELVGILTETDILRKAVALGMDLRGDLVDKIMSKPIISVELSINASQVADLMGDAGIRHMAVRDGGKIIGIVSARDLLVHFRRQSEPKMGID